MNANENNALPRAKSEFAASGLFGGVVVKPDSLQLLRNIGISRKHALAIQGKSGLLTGRHGADWSQVEFDGAIIGWGEPFMFCIPNSALTPNGELSHGASKGKNAANK